MAKPYFRQVPNFEYVSRNQGEQYSSEYVAVKNLFKRAKLRDDIFQNLAFFEKYQIVGDERPDNVAFKIYGDSTLDWIILLSNNMLNVQTEWPLSQVSFDKYVLDKYGSYENLYREIHHWETIEVKDNSGITIVPAKLVVPENFSIEYYDARSPNRITLGYFDANNKVTDYEIGEEIKGINSGSLAKVIEIDIENNSIIFEPLNSSFFYAGDTIIGNTSQTRSVVLEVNSKMTIRGNITVPVTNYEYEIELENKKRNIFILKPKYLNIVFNDMDEIMPYKKGSQQYIAKNLKRGDNIRLYE
jgi:hypothetical protein